MLFLPHEVQLDVLKCLKFEQLFSFKQTNFYYRNLIEKYEGELARVEFFKLSLLDTLDVGYQLRNSYKIVNLEPVISYFVLDGQLMKKWKAALAESVPLFLHGYDYSGEDFVVQMEKTKNKKPYILNLPNIPKTIEEMIIIRFWLQQLSNCSFEEAELDNIFNPTIINLLFDNETSLHFHIQTIFIGNDNATVENFLKFGLNLFTIYDVFSVALDDLSERLTDILFNIIANEGKKLPHVFFGYCDTSRLYDLIIKYITTSKDFSKMVSFIFLLYDSFENIKIPERAKDVVTKQSDNSKIIAYQIINIYNPIEKFLFMNAECGPYFGIYIARMERMEKKL
uniref:F-box domain-containing protein n=1 Tax=Meloidogyne enterolobii TaxID=390850 RepID=A0A6V7TVZ3_MELEN|nr:unnamed protein product [Meloidogyne enterolobii]